MQNLRRTSNTSGHYTLAKYTIAIALLLGCSACTTTNSAGSYDRLLMMQSFSQNMQGYDTLYSAPQLPMRPVMQIQQGGR